MLSVQRSFVLASDLAAVPIEAATMFSQAGAVISLRQFTVKSIDIDGVPLRQNLAG